MRQISVLSSANFRILTGGGGVFRYAVVRVEGEEQWGENTALRSSSAECTGAG